MNPNPPSQTRLPFRRPPPRRATARRGRPGGLPRFTTGSARDAINLRWNYKDEINLATGEWTRAGYRAPACYVTNAWPIIRATFSAAPADLSSVTLLAETDAAIGGFAATNVAFAGGAASPPTLVESAMIEYGFSEWPLTESTNLVSETWEPSLQWPLDPGAVVETNREHKSETEPTKPVGIKDK